VLDAATAAVVAELADLVARDELEFRSPESLPSTMCGKRTEQLELRHTRGKLVLRP